MQNIHYNVLNASQRKDARADRQISNPKEFVVLQKEKKIYIATPAGRKIFMESRNARSVGLFLGALENNVFISRRQQKTFFVKNNRIAF